MTKPRTKPLGQLLRIAREDKGFFQRDVSQMVGLSQSALSRYETGERAPSREMLRLLCKILGVSADAALAAK